MTSTAVTRSFRILALILIGLASQADHASAHIYPQRSFADTLLRADAIFFATVVGAEVSGESNATLSLSDIRVVKSRLLEPLNVRFTIAMTANQAEGAGLFVSRYLPLLVPGQRYLFLLGTNGPPGYPLIDFADPLYHVQRDGRVTCPGGLIYGIGATGFACAREGDQIGKGLSETMLLDRLLAALDSAEKLRPKAAHAYRTSVKPLMTGWSQ